MKTLSTIFFQIFCEFMLHTKVIFKSMIDPEEDISRYEWVNPLTHRMEHSWLEHAVNVSPTNLSVNGLCSLGLSDKNFPSRVTLNVFTPIQP